MKILHVPFTYFPDAAGGTEIYVAMLAKQLMTMGIENVIAAPGTENQTYVHDGLRVHRYPVSNHTGKVSVNYGSGDAVATRHFIKLLDHIQPDIVHLHALTAGVSLDMAEEAKRRGCWLVFTYHTPTVSCLRGTLMRWGNTICDGRLKITRCTSCMLHSRGLHQALSQLIGRIPPAVGQLSEHIAAQSRLWTALRMSYFAQRRHQTLRQFFSLVDRIVVLCNWVGKILVLNDVPASKIVVSRHGLAPMTDLKQSLVIEQDSSALRLAFLGRLHPTKGIDTVVQAIRNLPDAPMTLDIYGIMQDGDEAYAEQLRLLCGEDGRIHLLAPLPHEAVEASLRQYDALVVPSRWLETGPLVILEAFAAGIPVLGSNLGGIAELVTHEQDGLLIEVDSVLAWQHILNRCINDASLLGMLKSGVRPPRTIENVADDMLQIYQNHLSLL